MINSLEIPSDVKFLNWLSTVLFGFFILLLLSGLIFKFIINAPINLQNLVIRGDVVHHDISSFRENIVPSIQGNFYTLNLNQVKATFESLPWISKAIVRRSFPNKLEVVLQEHQPVAVWGKRDDFKMVNIGGLTFDSDVDDEESERLPQFIGPDGQSKLMLDMYRQLLPLISSLKAKLLTLELSSRGSWMVTLEDGAHIELGRGTVEVISDRVKQFINTLNLVTSKFGKSGNVLQYADLRHSDGSALRLNGVKTVNPVDLKSTVKK